MNGVQPVVKLAAEPATPDRAAGGEPVAAPVPRWRRYALLVARMTFTAAVLGAVGYATATQWPDVRATLIGLAWHSVVLSLLLVIVGLGLQTMAWRAALADLGHPVGRRTAGQIFLVGMLAKYLPGSVWSFMLQMELGRRAQVPRSRAFLASLLSLGLSSTAAIALGLFGLPVLAEVGRWAVVLLFVALPVALLCAHPGVLTGLSQRFLRLTRRQPLTRALTWRGVGAVIGWSTLAWMCFGVHLWLLASDAAVPGWGGLLRCVGAFALALTVGIMAFLSPSGLGVREAVVVVALLPYVTPGVALGLALASRLIFTVADLTAAGGAALAALWTARHG